MTPSDRQGPAPPSGKDGSAPTRVLVVDDHALVRASICRILGTEKQIEVVGQTDTGGEAVTLCNKLNPDLVILDYKLPDMDGLDTVKKIAEMKPGPKILVLTMYENEEYAIRLIRAGASGFIVKGESAEELLLAIQKVMSGKTYISRSILDKIAFYLGNSGKEDPESALSNREFQVLVQLARGATSREIAENLHLSLSTVDTHRSRILSKLNLRNNSDITRFAIRRGLVDLD